MNVLPISHDILNGIKRRILRGQRKDEGIKSAHLSEAFAAGFGYKSNIALQSSLKLDRAHGYAVFDNDAFDDRLEELTGLGREEIYTVLLVTPLDAIIEETGFAPADPDPTIVRAAVYGNLGKLNEVFDGLRTNGIESITYAISLNGLDHPRMTPVETILAPRRPLYVPAPERMDYAFLVERELGSVAGKSSEINRLGRDAVDMLSDEGAVHVELIFSIFTGLSYRGVIPTKAGGFRVSTITHNAERVLKLAHESIMAGPWDDLTLRKSRTLEALPAELRKKIVEISDRARLRRAIGRGYLINIPRRGAAGAEILTPTITRSWERQALTEADQTGSEIAPEVLAALHEMDMLDRVQVAGTPLPDGPEEGVFALNLHPQRALRHLRETRPELFAPEAKPVSA
ncbi:hypothetical protein [Thioclava sp. F36-6]|uniref:hypothetical protein n=1 Tax=Thioclava sp. F36-6 TaxID=1915316 RepID=UPI0009976F18|nr:hypothetical protein [Thioclava sp. F36-6]OOY32611.1 hypothetical protein BMI88_01610 [Thioclava sp. F36-6]